MPVLIFAGLILGALLVILAINYAKALRRECYKECARLLEEDGTDEANRLAKMLREESGKF